MSIFYTFAAYQLKPFKKIKKYHKFNHLKNLKITKYKIIIYINIYIFTYKY